MVVVGVVAVVEDVVLVLVVLVVVDGVVVLVVVVGHSTEKSKIHTKQLATEI